MNDPTTLSLQSRRLLQIGVSLFLFTSLEGFAIPHLAAPTLARSVHTLSGFTGVLLVAHGLLWPRLELTRREARFAFWLLVYSALATIAAFLLASFWGAGNSVIPMAAGGSRGTAAQEAIIQAVLYSAAPTGIAAFALVLWGLSTAPLAHRDVPSITRHA